MSFNLPMHKKPLPPFRMRRGGELCNHACSNISIETLGTVIDRAIHPPDPLYSLAADTARTILAAQLSA
jgi:hypothetical protein